ncbi:hypothetical protein [Streptomyces pratensis]|uniref:hypothetical protein n=1 Tax=Streptomyces pratensis TaxID=1169025 RepID=UPI003644F8C2
MDEQQQLWATSGITTIRRDPAQPGVCARVHADIRRTNPGSEAGLPQAGEGQNATPASDRVKELFPKDIRHAATNPPGDPDGAAWTRSPSGHPSHVAQAANHAYRPASSRRAS